ncbi:Glutathione S-transferase-like protein [Sphingopyxis sp. LC81]|uniref:glutathione S-transferase family protein n=1 Tax=Sphingopyxis sp. LC81 TaxID=1502850 RepID=UPI0005102D87|nr:glutathione S-transferase family protein [Sphingopyxis sp. LC81]KGB54916.1 Glutathione S-transferase-like protein [Sphingopyxis sp. LC81]
MLIVGSPVSPYVRKILAILHLKGLDYELDPITPFYGNDEFSKLSPLRRIPVLVDGDLVINDSTVIAEYLDEAYPDVPVLPKGPRERAQARWIEEYADSRLGDLCIWSLFFPKIVAPHVFKRPPDEAAIAKVTDTDLPEAIDWIEERAPAGGFLFGDAVSIADLAVACPLRNAAIAGWTPDPARWPRTAAWLDRIAALPCYARTLSFEPAILATRADGRRAALEAAGVKVAEQSFGADNPRASIMLR